jgi:hypothetical protein
MLMICDAQSSSRGIQGIGILTVSEPFSAPQPIRLVGAGVLPWISESIVN